MNQEMNSIKSVVDQLTKKIERQEWRIVDLEKRVVQQQPYEYERMEDDPSMIKEISHEPVLQKAYVKRLDTTAVNHRMPSRFRIGTYLLGALFFMGLGACIAYALIT